ncbi:MAG TPA: hypothetical protein VF057_00645 [Thermoanaerobaculia bacterium]
MRTIVLAPILLLAVACATAARPERHILYLHGRIVQEQQSARPQHPEHGFYELDAIRAAFRDRGFTLHSEIRPKGSSVSDGADRAVARVRELLDAGVPADRITVVGASMGAAIALHTSARLQNPNVRFVLLGPCLSRNFPAVAKEEGKPPMGRILVIRDTSDVPECPPFDGRASEVVINTGLGHGYLYRPLSEWIEPAVAWALSD